MTQLRITLDDLNTIRTALTSGVIVADEQGTRPAVERAIDNIMISLMQHRGDIARLPGRTATARIRQLRRLLGHTCP